MMNYSLEVDLGDEGQLVVRALRAEWLQRAADLLADTFVDTLGIQPYRCVVQLSAAVARACIGSSSCLLHISDASSRRRCCSNLQTTCNHRRRYVRRNMSTYLEQHAKLPPEAVVLTAVLRTASVRPESDLLLDELCSDDGSDGEGAATSSSSSSGCSSSSSSGVGSPQQQQDSGSSSLAQAAAEQQQQGLGGAVRSALQQLTRGLQLQPPPPQPKVRVVEQLVGIAEISLREDTRSQSLTLNPPKVRAARLLQHASRSCLLGSSSCMRWPGSRCILLRSTLSATHARS